MGLAELVTQSLDDYEIAALRLASDPLMLSDLKRALLRNRVSSPLFDTRRFTRHLEAAFATMMERHQRGDSPAPFVVEPLAALDERR